LSIAGQHELKQKLLLDLGLQPDRWVEGGSDGLGYRWSSKRVAQGPAGRVVLGSYARNSHRIADMTDCLVEHPRIQETARQLQRLANEQRIAGYDEGTSQGDLRYVWIKTNGEQVLVTLIAAREITPALRTLAQELTTAQGVWGSVQSDTGNAIRGHNATHLCGIQTLSLKLEDVSVEVGPLGFLQPNPLVAVRAYHDLCCEPGGMPVQGQLALDVYAGAGVTTRQLQARFGRVIANDVDPESAHLLNVAPQDAASFLAQQHAHGAQPDLIVCNPPRGGMGAEVCNQLLALAPARIHIMSCNPVSLARDLAALGTRYTVEGVRAYDTLPQTMHVEALVWLTRRSEP